MCPEETSHETGNIPDLDPVVHAPARLAILGILHIAESADFVFLMRKTGLSSGNLSTHLTKLEAAGYVSIEKKFVDRMPRTLVSLTDIGREALRKYRQQMNKALGDLPE
jgi:DNA-binding MarR family transcriptional regulator